MNNYDLGFILLINQSQDSANLYKYGAKEFLEQEFNAISPLSGISPSIMYLFNPEKFTQTQAKNIIKYMLEHTANSLTYNVAQEISENSDPIVTFEKILIEFDKGN